MLMNKIRDTYREITGQMVTTEPVNSVPAYRPAANESNMAKSEKQARRHRRQRRMERTGQRGFDGWTVRTW